MAEPTQPSQLVFTAWQRACQAHAGMLERDGTPYVGHVARVARRLIEAGQPDTTVAAGFLHDTLEDTLYTAAEMTIEFGHAVTSTVIHVTKVEGEAYGHLIAKAATTAPSTALKLADVIDHLDPIRRKTLSKTGEVKYRAALETLVAAAAAYITTGHLPPSTVWLLVEAAAV